VLLAAHGSTNVEVAGARAVVPLRFSGTGPAPCRGRTGLDGQAEVLQQERHRHADYAADAEKPWSRRRRFLGPASGAASAGTAVAISASGDVTVSTNAGRGSSGSKGSARGSAAGTRSARTSCAGSNGVAFGSTGAMSPQYRLGGSLLRTRAAVLR